VHSYVCISNIPHRW